MKFTDSEWLGRLEVGRWPPRHAAAVCGCWACGSRSSDASRSLTASLLRNSAAGEARVEAAWLASHDPRCVLNGAEAPAPGPVVAEKEMCMCGRESFLRKKKKEPAAEKKSFG